MGGNVFNTKRVNRKEYNKIAKKVVEKLKANFKGSFIVPLEIKEKETFGDLDILVTNLPNIDDISKIFNTKNHKRTKGFISFEYEQFQVDLNYVEVENLEYQFLCNSFGDLNGLLGSLTRRLGVKLSSKGLFYVKDINGQAISFLLSKNFYDVFDILKIPFGRSIYEEALKGNALKNYDDIFSFIMSSPYFNPSYFIHKNFNSRHRARVQKRDMFKKFEHFILSNNMTIEDNKESAYGQPDDLKTKAFPEIVKMFPHLPEKIKEYEENVRKRKKDRQKRRAQL